MSDCVRRLALQTVHDLGTLGGVVLAMRSVANFRLSLRAQARLFWRGDMSRGDFVVEVQSIIDRGYRRAWRQGAAECGLKMDELSDAETDALQGRINEQFPHVNSLADDFNEQRREEGGKLGDMFGRLEQWVARYEQIRNEAKVMACKNRPLEWKLGPTEHCASCMKLRGQVRRASFWNERGILPRVPNANWLVCRGFNCQCALSLTSKPISRGRFPSLP